MFDQLTARLTEAIQRVTGRGRITEENVRDTVRTIRIALLEADVALPVAKALVERVRDRALGEEVARSLNPGQAFVKIVHDEIVAVLGGDASAFEPKGHPAVVMLVGLQGAGKTTTAAKLARWLKDEKKRNPYLVPADVRRPAAIEQLQILGGQIDVAVHPSVPSKSSVDICREALLAARHAGHDVCLFDTAGRLHIDDDLMRELAAIKGAVAPHQVVLVVDLAHQLLQQTAGIHYVGNVEVTSEIALSVSGRTVAINARSGYVEVR